MELYNPAEEKLSPGVVQQIESLKKKYKPYIDKSEYSEMFSEFHKVCKLLPKTNK